MWKSKHSGLPLPVASSLLPRVSLSLRLALAALALAAVALAFGLGWRAAADRLTARAGAEALSRVQTLESVLATQRAVAAILSDDGLAIAALRAPTPAATDAVSQKLERLRAETGSTVIYLLDRTGLAIAASNWAEPASFVGASYAFRDYYTRAMAEGRALQFALGTVSHRPGLYLSHDVRDGGDVAGVVVVKIEFDAVEAAWAAGDRRSDVADATGLVVISSEPAARFQPMPPKGIGVIAERAIPGAPGWVLRQSLSPAPAVQAGLLAGGGMLACEALLATLILRTGRSRRRRLAEATRAARYRADLEQAVEERTRALTAEMTERQAAEARLARMQADLVQANKLATLGQVTAGLAHEVNQPLATIRLLAENGIALLPSSAGEARGNLERILRMSDRIGQITTHLRGFARKATGRVAPVSLRAVIDSSILLTASRRRGEAGRIAVTGPVDTQVQAESVRLEQILVNLIQNAQEAMADRPDPWLRIAVATAGANVELTVADNGPGIAPEAAAQLFTPFASTKPDGLGLGLVIARDIARDLGGELSLDPPEPGIGARFRLRLARA